MSAGDAIGVANALSATRGVAMRYRRLLMPVVSLLLWACSDQSSAPLDPATTGGIRALLDPPVADFGLSVDGKLIGRRYQSPAVLEDLPPGIHDVGMDVDAGECRVTRNSRQVNVVAGRVSEVIFGLMCPLASIVVDVSTSGKNVPQHYTAYAEWTIDLWCEWFSCKSALVPANGSVTLQDLWTVSHRVMLVNLPTNCAPSNWEESVTVATGAPRRVAFSVVCT